MTAKRHSLFSSSIVLWLLFSSQGAFAVEIEEIGQSSSAASKAASATNSAASTRNAPAPTKQLSVEQRLSRMERAVNSTVLIDLARQQQELQMEVERLRGENEELIHTLEGMQTRLRDMYRDLDQRIQGVEKRAATAAPAVAPGGAVTEPTPVAGDAVAERKAYERAFKMLREKRYKQAIQAFQRFLKVYPASDFADNAQYWIGEGHYVTRDFKAAASSFSSLLTAYPQSSKVADAHLKLGFSQYELKQYKEARNSLNTVIQHHAKSTAARLAKERLTRMDKEGR